jgi:ABC-type Mn2+/Zn2+ transport system ATPase subunit
MMACLAELASDPSVSGRTVVTSHDPEFVAESLAPGRQGREDAQDDVVWIEGQRAHRLVVDREVAGWRWATIPGENELPGLHEFQDAMRRMLTHAEAGRVPRQEPIPPQSFITARFPLIKDRVSRAGYRFEVREDKARIAPGELAILSGPSGAGKSTLLRQMAEPLRGEIAVGWVPQELARALPPETPVHEALGVGKLQPFERETIREWYGEGFTEDLLPRPVGSLSEGERQRVLLTAEVLRLERAGAQHKLRLLLMDEPFGSVDPAAHLRMMRMLGRWLSRGQHPNAAVLVSHSPGADASLARGFRVPVLEWRVEGASS